jgi:predicted metal-dependent hydrolase
VAAGQRLLEAGFPFAAHEVFELQWKARPADERDLWQGLAQVCVAVTHAQRGNAPGAARLRERAAQHLNEPAAADAGARYAVDVTRLVKWCSEAGIPAVPQVEQIES